MSDAETPPIDPPPDEVGYGKPSKATQWKKGQSGNPAGKQKVDKSIGVVFRKVANKRVATTNGHKTETATLMELLLRAPLQHGMKGNTKNAELALYLLEEFGTDNSIASLHPKPGVIYRDYHGNAKVDYRFDAEKFSKAWDKFKKLHPEDCETPDEQGSSLDTEFH